MMRRPAAALLAALLLSTTVAVPAATPAKPRYGSWGVALYLPPEQRVHVWTN